MNDAMESDLLRIVEEDTVKQAMSRILRTDEVTFRSSQQQEALMSIVNTNGRTPLVVVLPTGGGKSLLFMVPASLEDAGITVVVVPFRALLDNLLQKAQAAGIDSVEWKSGSTPRAALVLVSADNVSGTGFVGHVQQWQQNGLLCRVFVDEAHLTFKDNHWRAKLAGLKSCGRRSARWCCLQRLYRRLSRRSWSSAW